MKKTKYPPYVHCWVIRSNQREKTWFYRKHYWYHADRVTVKSPQFKTDAHWRVKLFDSKEEAEARYYARVAYGHSMQGFRVVRKKVWLNEDGTFAFFKNSPGFK